MVRPKFLNPSKNFLPSFTAPLSHLTYHDDLRSQEKPIFESFKKIENVSALHQNHQVYIDVDSSFLKDVYEPYCNVRTICSQWLRNSLPSVSIFISTHWI
mmetsp:Transcript_22963/g.55713  ORF Transcript_22963/g.55713 Transcript_22963/m.55713 type:complete len:100 (-) Transcript_22963:169-468(-)